MTYHMDNQSRGWQHLIFDAHRRAILPWIVERADKILVSSRDYAETCALNKIPGAKEKIIILPFGVDLERFHPGRDEAFRAALGIARERPLLLFVGGLDRAHYFKGLSVLIEALSKLKDKPWELLVVGAGEMSNLYAAQARLAGLDERVKFFGAISEKEKPRAYRAADLHLFPSLDRSEAFGLVALEAAASGLPCIASDLPGVRSVVLEGETGWLVQPENSAELAAAITASLDDVARRQRFGAAARQRAESEFAWEPLMDRLEEVYCELVK
jgi:glycosyltransferase involved in cell wall biosynthesis